MRALLTRPLAQSVALGAALRSYGIDSLIEPLLEIVPRAWDHGALAGRQAILVTSANAARELIRTPVERRDRPVFAVGPATAAPLRAAGFTDVRSAGGTAEALVELVRRELDPRGGPLLHLSGAAIARDLAAALRPSGFRVDRLIVYEAQAVRRLSAAARRELAAGRIDAVLFLSARTAATFRDLVVSSGLARACASMTAVALSPEIAHGLRALTFRSVAAAAHPSMDALLDVMARLSGAGAPPHPAPGAIAGRCRR